MTLASIQTLIYKKTGTNATSYPNADMVLDINDAASRVHALIRKYIDNFRPTAWTSSDLSTGTATPVFDALYHDLLALWPAYNYFIENGLPNASALLDEILRKESDLEEFYGMRDYHVFTVTIASPGVFTSKEHGLKAGDRISIISSGSLPTGLSVDTFYWVISDGLTTDDFRVATTKTGSAVNTSGTQSGTHWYFTDKVRRIIPSADSSNLANSK